MKKVLPPQFKFTYSNVPESEDRLRRAYYKIFTVARENILKRKKIGGKEVKVININHEEEILHVYTM